MQYPMTKCTWTRSFFVASAWGLPPVWQKNLLKLAFPAPKSPKGTFIQTSKMCTYLTNNQWHMRCILNINSRFLGLKTTAADFEFNKPILKKGPPILKYFEGFASFFKGF